MLITKKLQRSISPIRYPGGKAKAVRKIIPYFPERMESMVSPFLGGGSIEVVCANEGVRVFGYDLFDPLATFWKETLHDATALAETVQSKHWPLSSERFYQLQAECLSIVDPHQQAAVFYVINRASYSGAGLSGGCPDEKERYTEHFIDFLRNFQCPNLTVGQSDFHQTLAEHQEEFAYLDPPYVSPISGLYGRNGDCHNSFDHHGLADILRSRENWMLSYDDHPMIRELYRGHLCVYPEWRYGMNKSKESNEILIFSHDLEDWAESVEAERGDQCRIVCNGK